jgi:hypothetical protein
MFRLASTIAIGGLLLSANAYGAPRAPSLAPIANSAPDDPSPTLQGTPQGADPAQPPRNVSPDKPIDKSPDKPTDKPTDKPAPSAKAPERPLQPMSRLSLVRYVDGELVRVVKTIPAGKRGFHLKAGAPLDENALRIAIASAGSAINPGDHAQITNLEFKERQIIVDINGGGRGRTRLRDRIHLEVGGIPTMTTTTDTPVNTSAGATLYLDFGKPLPDMTPKDLKQFLSGLLDFSMQHSAAVQWVETLPPDIRKAIQDKQPIVGMDHEMVLAAIGRPDRKVREKGPDGGEIEDWIYGKPPAKTIFVSFEGDKVTQVRQFPQ